MSGDQLMTKRQLAELWGVTEGTVSFWLHTGALRKTKVGRLTRIAPADAEAFKVQCTSAAEAKQAAA